MGLGCGARTLKFCLFIFNLVFLICGVVCVGIGIWLMVDRYAVDNLMMAMERLKGHEKEEGVRNLVAMLAAVRHIGLVLLVGGLVVIVVAFLGCCGAAKEWRPLLCCYAVCLMVILATEITAGIYATAMHNSPSFEEDLKTVVQSTLRHYNGTESHTNLLLDHMKTANLFKAVWDKLMIDYECCGVMSKKGEFNDSGWFRMTKGKNEFPPACCPLDDQDNLLPECILISRHPEGCYVKIRESVDALSFHFAFVAGTVVLIALIQIFGIVVAFSLCNAISTNAGYF